MAADILAYVGGFAGGLVDRLSGASLTLVVAALLLHVAKTLCRARGWQSIVSAAYPEGELRYRHALGAYSCGVGLNSVVPARPGELLKLALVRRRVPEARYEGLVSTLVTESVFDALTGVVAIGAAVAFGWASVGGALAEPLGPVVSHPLLAAGLVAFVAAVLVALWRSLGSRARRAAHEARRGLAAFGCPRSYVRTVLSWQIAALGFRLATIACFLAAFHLPATGQTALVVLAVQCVTGAIPLTPNGAGAQQALLAVALGSSFATSQVIGFSAGAQLATTAADVVLGGAALLLLTRSLRWRRVLPPAEQELPATAPA